MFPYFHTNHVAKLRHVLANESLSGVPGGSIRASIGDPVLRYFLAQAVSQDILGRGRGSRICWEGQAEVFSD